MKKLRNIRNKKYFNIASIIIMITMILFIIGIILLKYQVEGETNMPFSLSKIAVISSSGGTDKTPNGTKFAFDVYQSNDIFLYLDKNKAYGKTEAIKTVTINNILVEGKKKDNTKIYKPDEKEEKSIFENKEENRIEQIQFSGSMESNIKQLKISNQGGIVAFRCSLEQLAEYQSNEEVINHQELLKKANIRPEDLILKLTFDLQITLEKGSQYKTTIHINLPAGNVIEEGVTSTEMTEVKEFIFKRM